MRAAIGKRAGEEPVPLVDLGRRTLDMALRLSAQLEATVRSQHPRTRSCCLPVPTGATTARMKAPLPGRCRRRSREGEAGRPAGLDGSPKEEVGGRVKESSCLQLFR
ncbi:hypothetical protein [Streptomyces sp. NPDC086010]|uniref:hypothetical protein n=1 Tax=Streptomyces sp. NPDC086010 TaxID=3365745 RepID=UPI0037CCDF37